MKKNYFSFFLLIIPLFSQSQSLSPTLISTSGGSYQAASITLDFAVGETAISTHQNQYVLTEGFFQPDLFLVNSDDIVYESISIKVFPNPATYSLKIQQEGLETYTARIFDQSGKLVKSARIEESTSEVPVGELVSGTYHLSISNNNQKPHSFTFIKI